MPKIIKFELPNSSPTDLNAMVDAAIAYLQHPANMSDEKLVEAVSQCRLELQKSSAQFEAAKARNDQRAERIFLKEYFTWLDGLIAFNGEIAERKKRQVPALS